MFLFKKNNHLLKKNKHNFQEVFKGKAFL